MAVHRPFASPLGAVDGDGERREVAAVVGDATGEDRRGTAGEGQRLGEALGEGVVDLEVGQRVAYVMTAPGAYCEKRVVPAERMVPLPDDIDGRAAAAMMLKGMTAERLLHKTARATRDDTVLIHAAAGGTGAILVQIAKLRGARVIGTVGTDEKAQLAREAGADETIVYTKADFEAETKRLTDGKGVDVVYDSVGKDTFNKSLNCLRPRGYMVLFGQASGRVEPMDPQVLNQKGSLYLTRPTLGAYTLTRDELLGRANDLFTWMQEGKLTVRIDQSFPLREAAEAHRYLEGRNTKGKVLLIP